MDIENEPKVKSLFHQYIQSWNNLSATALADMFTSDGNLIGFDGSQVNGRVEIGKHFSEIFNDHKPAKFVAIVREVRFIGENLAILRAAAGMTNDGNEIISKNNMVISMVAEKHETEFLITLFQATPAALHNEPELAKSLTDELTAFLKQEQTHP